MRDELGINLNVLDSSQNLSAKNFKANGLNITIISAIIYLVTYTSAIFINQNGLYLTKAFFVSSAIFLLAIVFGLSISKKFNILKQVRPELTFKTLYLSTLVSLFFLLIIFTALKIDDINRTIIVNSISIGLVIESFFFILLVKNKNEKINLIQLMKASYKYMILDGLILSFFCYFEVLANVSPSQTTEKIIVLIGFIFISWIISALTTHKFIPTAVAVSRLNAFELQVKFYLRLIALVSLSIIFLQFEMKDSIEFIRALAGYSIISSLLFILLFAEKIKNKTDEATVVFLKAFEMNELPINNRKQIGKYRFNNSHSIQSVVNLDLDFEHLRKNNEVFSVLNTILDLQTFDIKKSLIINSDEINDISSRQQNSYQLVVNLHNLNDQIKLNDYILDVRRVLLNGGVFVGALLPHHYRYRRYLKKHSFIVANIFYFFDFIWKRVMPKLPITREIYFSFSKEKDRAISLAEGLGRLVYCGFNVLNLVAVDDVVYFAAVKDGVPHTENKFFYSPVFKMNRIGKNGKEIKVYKLRTMYPYAEYLQDYIVKLNGYSKIGKPANDFRLPVWGNFFRKYWLDELPQLLNVLKGQMKLVGIRPLSKKVYNDYPEDLKKLRKKHKPGCIPPYVSLMMQSMEKSIEAERIYLNEKEKRPVITDFKYFFNALYNILSRKIRSS